MFLQAQKIEATGYLAIYNVNLDRIDSLGVFDSDDQFDEEGNCLREIYIYFEGDYAGENLLGVYRENRVQVVLDLLIDAIVNNQVRYTMPSEKFYSKQNEEGKSAVVNIKQLKRGENND